MAGERLLLGIATVTLVAALLPAPAAAAPAGACDAVGAAPLCEEALSRVDVRELDAGWWHNCALLSTGNVDCWGLDEDGQAADYAGGDAVDVATGANHTCVALEGGDLQCWGDTTLAAFDTFPVFGDAQEVSAGAHHTCYRTASAEGPGQLREVTGPEAGQVRCTGSDTYDQAGNYGDDDAVGAVAGGFHSCALAEDGTLECWGYSQDDRIGDRTDVAAADAGPATTCVVRTGGAAGCFGESDLGQSPSFGDVDAVEVAAGGTHACVRMVNGVVDCAGDDRYGQAADDDRGDVQAVAAGYVHTCVLRVDGAVDCWGDDRFGQAADERPGPVPRVR